MTRNQRFLEKKVKKKKEKREPDPFHPKQQPTY